MKELQNIQTTTILDVELQFALEEDVWFNATKMVKNFNKKNGVNKDLSNFWKSANTIEYIEELEMELATVDSTVAPENNGLKMTINNGDETSGTYVHPELGILLARYLSTKFARACDKFIKETISKNPVKELTPFQHMELAYKGEAESHKKTQKLLEVEKGMTKVLEQELDAITDLDGLIDMRSFALIVTSKTNNIDLGRTKVYQILRACGLVGEDTRATQRGEISYMRTKLVEGLNGKMYPKTFVVAEKFDKLLSLMIRKVKEDKELNKHLNFPFGE